MSGKGRRRRNGQSTAEKERLRQQQYERQLDQQAASAGQKLQGEQLKGMLQNPDVLEVLLDADEPDDEALADIQKILDPHLHNDEVLSILSDEDLWRKSWDNKLTETKVRMRFPADEARTPDPRVERVMGRVNGHTRRPLSPREKNALEARMKQKSDRARRAAGGTLQELLLSQVVDVGANRDEDSGSDGGLLGWFGGDK